MSQKFYYCCHNHHVQTVPSPPEFMFQEAFLTTYRMFISPKSLMEKLLYRFHKFQHSQVTLSQCPSCFMDYGNGREKQFTNWELKCVWLTKSLKWKWKCIRKQIVFRTYFIGNRLFYFQTNPIHKKYWQKKSEVK